MSESQRSVQVEGPGTIPFRSIILPIHGSVNSQAPFAHALKLACVAHGDLEIVDVRSETEATEHIGVRSMLERWGVLPQGSHKSDVAGIGVRVKKVVKEGSKRRGVVERLRKHTHDLLVIGTETRPKGSVFGRDLAEYLSEYFGNPTLLVPSGARPFVNIDTGSVSLENILVPVGDRYLLRSAIEALRRLLAAFPGADPHIIGLHAGETFPDVDSKSTDKLRWSGVCRNEPVVQAIINTAVQSRADLIVMSTNGRDTLSQMIAGSNTQQVLRISPCPVLSSAAG